MASTLTTSLLTLCLPPVVKTWFYIVSFSPFHQALSRWLQIGVRSNKMWTFSALIHTVLKCHYILLSRHFLISLIIHICHSLYRESPMYYGQSPPDRVEIKHVFRQGTLSHSTVFSNIESSNLSNLSLLPSSVISYQHFSVLSGTRGLSG